jgi:hypothetical protein
MGAGCAVHDHERLGCCEPVGTLGVVPADDPRYWGGFVDARGVRHDPVTHASSCPKAS